MFSHGDQLIKKGDFIKIQYTAYDESGREFDSTNGDISKSLHGKQGPMLVVFGFDRLVPGLESGLENMKKGEKTELNLSPEHAFGNRNKNLLRIMSHADFARNQINPFPGLTVHVDTESGRQYGVIKSSSGGRVLVDFNHPLAGKNVRYVVELLDIITEPAKKVESILQDSDLKGEVKYEKETVIINLKEFKDFDQAKTYLETILPRVIPDIKKVNVNKVK